MPMADKKVFQIMTHVMPWEIDYCLVLFDTLARAKTLTNHIYRVDVGFNLSSYYIDWESSKLDKEFFVEKMQYYSKLLSNFEEVNVTIYEGDENYGHLNLQKSVVKPDNDYYIGITPDQLFDKSILSLFEQSVSGIQEKYFMLTAEIPKLWDASWDIISNSRYRDAGYDYTKLDRYDALSIIDTSPVSLKRVRGIKFAGWLDLYNKAFYEELVPVPVEWVGYGQWDLYALYILVELHNMRYPIDFAQYKLENAVTTSIESSNWNNGENRSIYKKRLSLKEVPSQRDYYDVHMNEYVGRQLEKILSLR
jgi:hypothetical protein